MIDGDEADTPHDGDEVQEAESKPEITSDEALTWIASIPTNPLLALLRHKDFAAVANRVFAGFRANQQGLAIPTVKQRIAQEATKNPQFGEKLHELYDSISEAKQQVVDPSSKEAQKLEHEAALARKMEQKRAAELRAMETLTEGRDRLKRELAEAAAKIAERDAALRSAIVERQKTEEDAGRLRHTVDAQSARIERLERQAKRHEKETADLVQEIRSLHKAPASRASKHSLLSPGRLHDEHGAGEIHHDNIWTESLRRNLELQHLDAVTPIVMEALRLTSDDSEVLEIAADLAGLRHDTKLETEHLKALLTSLLHNGRGVEALSIWTRLVLLHPSYPESKRLLQQIVALLPTKRGSEFDEANRVISRIKTSSQELYNRVLSAMASREALVRLFLPREAAEDGLNKTLITLGSKRITFGDAADAVDLGNRELVAKVAGTLRELKKSDPTRAAALIDEFSNVTADASYAVPLTNEKAISRTAVVDSSNIAWIGQEDLARGRPRLKSLLDVRKALRLKGYFPILLLADANLPYAIDDKEKFQHMVGRGEIRLVDAGVVADEEILRNAKRCMAVVVTNDYMEDWDPNNQVKKIGIALSHSGQVSFID